MVALGLFGGLLLGSGVALIVDKRSGLIFNEDELKALLPGPMLERLPKENSDRWKRTAELRHKVHFRQ